MARRRSSNVLPLNTQRGYRSPSLGRGHTNVGSPSTRASSSATGDLASALAPTESVLGPGMGGVLTPNVESQAPEGAPGAFGGEQSTSMIDALAGQPGPPLEAGPQPHPAGPAAAAATVGPYGGTSGNPAADEALMNAEATYGTPGNETPLSAATQSSMLGSSPGASLADIVPGYGGYTPSPGSIATYNQNKLLRMLMEGF